MDSNFNRRILLVDDNKSIHQDYLKILSPKNEESAKRLASLEKELFDKKSQTQPIDSISLTYEIDSAFQGEQAYEMALEAADQNKPYALIFMDVRMPPGWDGVLTISRIWEKLPNTEIVICTAYSDYSLNEIIDRLGTTDKLLFLKKPFDPIAVKQMVITLLEKWNLGLQARNHIKNLENEVSKRTIELKNSLTELEKTNKNLSITTNFLQESEERYRSLTSSASDAIIQTDEQGMLSFWNPAAAELFNCKSTEVVGKNVWKLLISTKDYQFFETLLDKFKANKQIESIGKPFELFARRPNGLDFPAEISLSLAKQKGHKYFTAIIRDITDRRKTEAEKDQLEIQLRQTQKLEAIGTMAGGIAHNFNNILAAILGYADLAKDEIPKESATHDYIKKIIKSGARAKDLVQNILAFSRQQIPSTNTCDPIINLKKFIYSRKINTDYNITINQSIDEKSNNIQIDSSHFKIILEHLYSNAIDAMKEKGGVLDFILENVELTDRNIQGETDITPGKHVKLTVKDAGHGMTSRIMEQIFNPFFTTKTVDKGDGIGLSIIYGIIRKNKGTIKVKSEAGKGSAFEVFFPIGEQNL